MKIGDRVYRTHDHVFCGTILEIYPDFFVCKTSGGWFRTYDLSGTFYTVEDPFVTFIRETLESVKDA